MYKIKIALFILIIILFLFFLFYNIILFEEDCSVVTIRGDRRKNKNRLRIAQYNVEWLFIDYDSLANCPGDGCTWKNKTEATKHMDFVTKRIKAIDPDIINLCEIDDCEVLNILKDKLDGGYLPYMVKGKSTDGQNVGMLTRVDPIKSLYRTDMKANYPILGSRCGYTGPIVNTEVRKHFITEFEFNNVKIAFISAHLRAIKKENFRCAEREAQANILQSIVYNYINKNYEIILIGDFNDFDAQVLDVNNDKPISQVLDILKGLKGEYAGTYQLQNIAENIVQENRYTDWWFDGDTCNDTNQRYSMIDHILVSDWVKQRITNAFIYHGYDNYCGKYDTDHYPVVIDLVL